MGELKSVTIFDTPKHTLQSEKTLSLIQNIIN